VRTEVRSAAALSCIVALLAGCGTVATRPPEAGARAGGYYKDDGPGPNPPANIDAIADAEPRTEPLNRSANSPYTALGRRYVPFTKLRAYRERGVASWYGRRYHGQRTSSGERYDMYAMTAAHPVLPIPSYARVTNLANGRSVVVRINDRGPFLSGRVIDLSYAAAWKLGYVASGSAPVEVDAITPQEIAASGSGPAAAPATAEASAPAGDAASAPIPLAVESGGIYLQLGAFAGRGNAEDFRDRIRSELAWLDRPIEVLQQDRLFRVHVGPYRSRAEAAGDAERLREAADLKAVVVAR
jgi:rare lipoprotein A